MYQDKYGYMWFGTYDGLNLYNGKSTFVYRFEPDNKYSLCSNIIHKISPAEDDYLWISTFLGLNKFSLKERRVSESYYQCPEAKLLACDSKGNTWVIHKKDYISYYTPQTKNFQDIHLPGINIDNVLEIFINNDDLYLITTDGELRNIKISDQNNNSNGIRLKVTDKKIHDRNILKVFQENNNLLFISKDAKLYTYNIISNTKLFLCDLQNLLAKYGSVSRIISFNNDVFFTFSNGELIKLDSTDNYSSELINSGIGIFCLLKDKKQDILWIGTDGQGVQMYYQRHEMFRNIILDNYSVGIQKPIRAIYTDEYNNLWIGTKGDGIIRINNYNELNYPEISQIIHNRFTANDGLSNNMVFSFLRSKYRNILWIGTEGPGLSYYSYRDNKVKTLTGAASGQIGKVHSICEINESTLWLATAGNGILEVNIKDDNSHLVVKSVNAFFLRKDDRVCNEFHSMNYDGKSTIFIGSRGGYGVVKFDIITKQYEFIQMSKSENSAIGDVLCLHQSKDSIFYIGASSGMTKMQFLKSGENIIKQFDRRDGIANDMIHGILEDNEGCLWLSTNKGLTKYNPFNNFFHNYSYPDLKVTEFSDDAYWKSPDNNRLFFGGINGLVWIDTEEDFIENNYKPDIHFFDLKISGESYPLDSYLNKEGYLEISSKISSFGLSFVALDYINGENYEYSYILEDYNTAWTELQKTNQVTFTNLPHGKYELKVKYKSDVFGSDDKTFSLKIIKLPPWYLTTWAILFYILVFLLIGVCIIYLIRKKIMDKQMILAQRIKEEQKDKLIDAKLNFFTNVTHEFCTPLTVINGVTEFIEKSNENDNNLKKYTDILKDNVTNLNNLIQEILDFRKMEEAKFDTKIIKHVSIYTLIHHEIASFIPIAEQSKINFEISVSKDLYWNTDISYFKRILINLTSNAFKYVNEEGYIKISAEIKDNELLSLKVYNTGQGIADSIIDHIFDRYRILEDIEVNSYSKKSSRNGVGLSICYDIVKSLQGDIKVKSETNKYAEFIVTLPLLEAVEEDEIFDEPILPKNTEDNYSRNSSEKPVVLVIDDNKDIVWMISNLLFDYYDVKGVYSAEEAIKAIERQTPALIITDIMMPGIDGINFIKQLKADKFTKHIPLIIVSAKISDKDQAEGFDVGADAYFTKPFSPTVLVSAIGRLLSTKTELRNYYYSPESAYEYTDGQLMHQEDKEFMNSVISIIKENLEKENLRPELIADKMGMNTRNLYRRFKKVASTSPNDFIKDYRFVTAAKLLVTTNLTIQEIIYKVGINNKSYFYREFFKKYNMTPKEYRTRQ